MTKCSHHLGAFALAAALAVLGLAAGVRPLPADNDSGISRSELGRLDLFLDSHPDIAQALEKDPALATNKDFVTDHPAWKAFLEDHPGIRTNLSTDSSAFMRAEDRFDAAEAKSDGTPKEAVSHQLRSFDNFLDQHPAIAKQLETNPSLIKNKDYVTDHPELLAFLKDNSAIRDSLQDNPQAFMKGVGAVDAAELKASSPKPTPTPNPPAPKPASDTLTKGQMAAVDNFLDANPGLAKELEAKPWMINNPAFVKDNPKLVDFLKDHPDIRDDWRADPAATMVDLERIDRLEASKPTMPPTKAPPKDDDSLNRGQLSALDKFLDANPGLAKQLEANPAAIDNRDFLNNNADLVTFLKDHPDLAEDWRANPAVTMTDLRRIDQLQAARSIDRGVDARTAVENFDNFLDKHPAISAELGHRASLATNEGYIDAHPELKSFLQSHPGVVQELRSNPQSFMTLISRFDKHETPRDEAREQKTKTAVTRK